jgi:hypothetical protein
MIPTGNPDPAPRPKLESGFPAVYNFLEREQFPSLPLKYYPFIFFIFLIF